MHPKYPNVFSPIKLGPVELKNRFYSSPHAVPMNILGKPTDDYIDYNVARARGGCGLIVLTMAVNGRAAELPTHYPPKKILPRFAHSQMPYMKPTARSSASLGTSGDAAGQWQPLQSSGPRAHSFGVQFNYLYKGVATRAMSKREIRGLLDSFRQSTDESACGGIRRSDAARVAWRADRAVSIPVLQPAHGRIWRLARKPNAPA